MNIPMTWLKEYVDIDCDVKTYTDKITLFGSKVEAVERFGYEITNVVTGKILSIVRHPDADKLVVAQVDIGKDEPVQIITAATNVYEGAYIPVALDGAVLAEGKTIKKGMLRGQESAGMMCSIEELGYSRQDYPEAPENGIYIFPSPIPLGQDVRPILELCDEVVEYEITSNRPDCFSVIGIAREASAAFEKPLRYPEIKVREEADGDINELIQVEIKNPELCPRYIARVVKNVKIEPSPQWLRHRLTLSGVRPINNIVDITNYVMLELGQPMHAFDIDNIAGRKIIVRNAEEGETFTTLDGTERTLDSSMLVIADTDKAVAIAGIMGGENSKVTGEATAVLFESANFNGANIRVSSKKLGLRTDASSKYEKSLDPNLALDAVNRAVQLVEELCCGQVVKGMADCYPHRRDSWTVTYSPDRINALLGTEIPGAEMEGYLARLGIQSENYTATVPTFRPDIGCEADIAEEVARSYGYDRIKPTLAVGTPTVGKKSRKQNLEEIVQSTMVAMGYCESLHFTFESPKVFDKLNIPEGDKLRDTVKITNPLGEDYSIMRTTTLNGLLQSLSTNYNRRNEEALLFEMGKVYLPKALPLTELPVEVNMLTIGFYGVDKDFYDLKGAVEKLLDVMGVTQAEYVPDKTRPTMHPGRTASIRIDGRELGFLGEVHPVVCGNYEIETRVYAAVINLDTLYEKTNRERVYKPLPKFPGMQRDIAMLVKEDIPVDDIRKAIVEKAGRILEGVTLFDVYKGKQIDEGFKSVAYKLSFRSPDRTLKDDEVTTTMNSILKNLEEKIGAALRQ